ncbi:hypothetical protein BDP27DRAFT_1453396 [Rhodocollybia butyracea]|uniref:Uncharacterized protein n=1 Tax=Rhodocollybia butyracea TaxID=206335 RepID=A0A9P5P9I2_9AGAR|nr:hypothetical protein BDP27DRAFT_1453396 [Rhodocollybia butyracea]
MATSLSEASVFSVQNAVLAPVISLAACLTMAFFGFYTLLFGISVYFLCTVKNIPRWKSHLAWTISLFLVTAPGSITSISSSLRDLVVLYETMRTQDDVLAFIEFFTENETQTALVGFSYTSIVVANTLVDSLLIHRIYIIWESRLWIIVLPTIASLATNAVGLASDILRTKGFSNTTISANFDLEETGIAISPGFFYTMAGVNLVLTIMLAGRIQWAYMRIRADLGGNGSRGQKYSKTVATVIECGILYPLSLLALATTVKFQDSIAIPVDMLPVVMQMAGIAPTLIIFRTCIGRSITENIVTSSRDACSFHVQRGHTSNAICGSDTRDLSLIELQNMKEVEIDIATVNTA